MTAPYMPPARRRLQQPAGPVQGGQYAQAFQDATNASTAMAREDLTRDIGKTLGGVAAIGGLRSGRVQSAVADNVTNFGRQVGNVAAANAGQLASLDASRMEGEANRGVQREGMQMQDRQFGQRLSYDQGRDAVGDARDQRNFDYGKGRDEQEFGYRQGRDAVGDQRDERNFNYTRDTDTRDFDYRKSSDDREFGYRGERDKVGDARDERNYGRSVLESDREFGYRGNRDQVLDARDARNFDYGKTRDDRGDMVTDRSYGRGVLESDRNFGEDQRRYNQDRLDGRQASRDAGRGAIIGGVLSHASEIGSAAKKLFGGGGGAAAAAAGAGAPAGGAGAAAGAGAGGLGALGPLGIAGVGIGATIASAKSGDKFYKDSVGKAQQQIVANLQQRAAAGTITPQQRQLLESYQQTGKLPGRW